MPNQKQQRYGGVGAGLFVLLLPLVAAADALLKPLPTPDLSKLPPVTAQHLAADRAEFDKARSGWVGPPLAQAYADIGVEYAQAGLKDVAAVAFYNASQSNPQDGRWFYLRGLVARDFKQNAEARANFEAALALDKIYLPIRYRLSDTLAESGDLDGARKVLEAAVREHADQAVAHAMLGQLSLRQKRYSDAIESLKRALQLEPQANQLYQPLAEAYTAVGNESAAKDAQAKAGKVTPQLADPLALSLYTKAGAPAQGGAQGAGGAQSDGTALQEAQRFASKGNIGAARDRLAAVLREHPNDIDALALQARLEASIGDFLIAQAAADQALSVAPDNASALLARGIVYEYAGDDNQAYSFYQRAARADARLAMARLLLGNAEMRRGRHAQAAEQYRQLTVLQPEDITALAHLVAAQVALGQCPRALADVGAAQKRKSNDGDLMQIFVSLVSTCAGTKAEERDMALDYAQALYKQRGDAGDAATLALALAAHGKYKEAQQYQAEAIFSAVRAGDKYGAELYKSTQAIFAANKVPDRPWPAEHPYFKPPLLTATRPAAAPPAKPAPPAAAQPGKPAQ